MIARKSAAPLAILSAVALLSCRLAAPPVEDARAPCPSLGRDACRRARGLVIATTTYADEQHDVVLLGPHSVTTGTGLLWTPAGWRPRASSCAKPDLQPAPALDTSTVTYAFAGVAVDGTLVASDTDLSPLLGAAPDVHEVRLMAIAFARDGNPPVFDPTPGIVVHAADDSCTCGDATHFAGAVRYGATLSFDLRAPRDAAHVQAIDFVRRALGDPKITVRESNTGLAVDGLASLPDGDGRPLVFRLKRASAVAFVASPLADVCGLPTPEITPTSIDFGVAPYGTLASRTVHVVNRAPVALQAMVGARTVPLAAHGAVDLTLDWTPDGDAQRCETQTRDEAILFLPAHRAPGGQGSANLERRARVFETVRTGRARASQTERVDVPLRRSEDEARAVRDWTCPPDYERISCRAAGVGESATVSAEPRGTNACHFECRGSNYGKTAAVCRFDAAMECALRCP